VTTEQVTLTGADRAAALAVLRDWRADVVVLADAQSHHDLLLSTLQELLGPGRRVDDVWLWDVG
jgi:hypothetical protein